MKILVGRGARVIVSSAVMAVAWVPLWVHAKELDVGGDEGGRRSIWNSGDDNQLTARKSNALTSAVLALNQKNRTNSAGKFGRLVATVDENEENC